MASTTNESTPAIPAADDDPRAAESSGRTDPIGIEIPVSVYASRYSVAGRGKGLPPVREETRTVIVFAQGAVVRLTANLSIGETVVLTNQQSGADVLCRVISVKAQPGIQNYVDLEFTQRAPGFWGSHANGGGSARTEAAPAVARTIPVAIPVPAALPQPTPMRLAAKPEAMPPTIDSRSESAAASGTLFPARFEPAPETRNESAGVSATMPGPISGDSAGLRTSRSREPILGSERLDWSEPGSGSKKVLWVAAALVLAAGIAGGDYLYTQRGASSVAPASITVAAPAPPPIEQATPTPTPMPDDSSHPVWTDSTSDASAGNAITAESKSATQSAAQQDDTAAESTVQPQPRRSAIPLGNLQPISRTAAISGSSEAPPALAAQNSGAEDVLRSGVLSGASRVEEPPPPGAPAPGSVVRQGGQLQMPRAILSPQPVYPEAARSQRVEGVVMMDALIDATGTVTDVKVLSGPLLLQQAAMLALRKWKYQPALLNGQPTSVHTHVSMTFTAP